MSKGARQRERKARREAAKATPLVTDEEMAALEEIAAGGHQHEEVAALQQTEAEAREAAYAAAAATAERLVGEDAKQGNPMRWEGDQLVQGRRLVATIDDFPQIVRARELNDRAGELRANRQMTGTGLFTSTAGLR